MNKYNTNILAVYLAGIFFQQLIEIIVPSPVNHPQLEAMSTNSW